MTMMSHTACSRRAFCVRRLVVGAQRRRGQRPSRNVDSRSQIIVACQPVAGRHRTVAHVLASQKHADLAERGSAGVVQVAALDEEVVDLARTDSWLRQANGHPAVGAAALLARLDVVRDQLAVGDAVMRSSTRETQQFP